MFELTQEQYENIVFLTKCIYIDDLIYPSFLGFQHAVVLLSGLKMNLFIGKDFDLFIICGTNSFRDWIANAKVGMFSAPRQYQQALQRIIQYYSTMDKNKKLVIAGHSLGGGIACYCKSFMPLDNVLCITFNACPVKHLCANKDDDNILNLISEHDILNNICNLLPGSNYMEHIGSTIILNDKYRFSSIKSHCDFGTFMDFKFEK